MMKTKTITLKKQARIIKTLYGLELNKSDSAKFRFWVKSKGIFINISILKCWNIKTNLFTGFTLVKPPQFEDFKFGKTFSENSDSCLYVRSENVSNIWSNLSSHLQKKLFVYAIC